jgi:hypothetical protein
LRFGSAAGKEETLCPSCDRPLVLQTPSDLVGYGLFRPSESLLELPAAIAAALALPRHPTGGLS